MINDQQSEFLLFLEKVLSENEDILLKDPERNERDLILIAQSLNQIRQNLRVIKDIVFTMDAEDEQHVRDLARTGVFSLEDLAHEYQISVDRAREIIGLGKGEELKLDDKENWKHALAAIVPRFDLDDSQKDNDE